MLCSRTLIKFTNMRNRFILNVKSPFYRPESWQADFPKYRTRLRLVRCISVQSYIKAVVEFCRHNATREPYPLSTRLCTFDLLQFLYNPQRSCLHRMCRVIERFKKRRKTALYILYFKYWLLYCDFTLVAVKFLYARKVIFVLFFENGIPNMNDLMKCLHSKFNLIKGFRISNEDWL